jgi:hypothetical protein
MFCQTGFRDEGKEVDEARDHAHDPGHDARELEEVVAEPDGEQHQNREDDDGGEPRLAEAVREGRRRVRCGDHDQHAADTHGGAVTMRCDYSHPPNFVSAVDDVVACAA